MLDPCSSRFRLSLECDIQDRGLDIFCDLNTIFTLIITENYWFAFFLSIIVARSFLKQLGLDSLPQAWTKTIQVRMMHRQLLEFFDEEKGSEVPREWFFGNMFVHLLVCPAPIMFCCFQMLAVLDQSLHKLFLSKAW